MVVVLLVAAAAVSEARWFTEPTWSTGATVTLPEPVYATPRTVARVVVPATVNEPATRLNNATQVTGTLAPPPSTTPPSLAPPRTQWGTHASTTPGRCTQFEQLIAATAPVDGWDVARISGFAWRESGCCPQTNHGAWVTVNDVRAWVPGDWETTQGGDRFDDHCRFSHVAVWHHRSDAGLLQINGINYDPNRCKNTCVQDMLDEPVNVVLLGDPELNVRVAAAMCEWWRNAGSSCYRPWQ